MKRKLKTIFCVQLCIHRLFENLEIKLLTIDFECRELVTALRIIEREERSDEECLHKQKQTGFLPPGKKFAIFTGEATFRNLSVCSSFMIVYEFIVFISNFKILTNTNSKFTIVVGFKKNVYYRSYFS